jgi:antitoxin VapB
LSIAHRFARSWIFLNLGFNRLFYIYADQEEKMALSIRNAKAEKLARELAAESGENITQAITRALEERLRRLRGRSTAIDMAEEIMKISKRCSEIPDQDQRSPDEILGL